MMEAAPLSITTLSILRVLMIWLLLFCSPSQQASNLGIKLIAHDRSLSEQVKVGQLLGF
jgi:hypothetical protein